MYHYGFFFESCRPKHHSFNKKSVALNFIMKGLSLFITETDSLRTIFSGD